ncbi:hypothetical protein OHA70_03835 [Kribbella sp. NBC_00382]|uniref:hypothetical protein n=1 Tax=Kribbella sp. NBC_00382 TaxID=2975967 RepID=UPI002E224196
MNRKSLAGWAAEVTVPPEIERRERWAIRWKAFRDCARYRRVPIGQATGWTLTVHARYYEISLAHRKHLEERQDRLEIEQTTLQAQLDAPPAGPYASRPRPTGDARELHDWARERRIELKSLDAQRTGTEKRQSAAVRLAAVRTELGQLESEYETFDALCGGAYLIRVELYNRSRYSRADRRITEVASGPPYEGPGWRHRRTHLASVQTRSA